MLDDLTDLPDLDDLNRKLNNLARTFNLHNFLDKHKRHAVIAMQQISDICRERNLPVTGGDIMFNALRKIEAEVSKDINPVPIEWIRTLGLYASRYIIEGFEHKSKPPKFAKKTTLQQATKFIKTVSLKGTNILVELDMESIVKTFYGFYETAQKQSNEHTIKKWGKYLPPSEVQKLIESNDIEPLAQMAISSFLARIVSHIEIKVRELSEETFAFIITESTARNAQERAALKSEYAKALTKNFEWRLKWELGIKRGRRKSTGSTYESSQQMITDVQAAIATLQNKNQKVTQQAVAEILEKGLSARQLRKWLTRYRVNWEKLKKSGQNLI